MSKPTTSPKNKVERMGRPFTLFLVLTFATLFFGDHLLSAEAYKFASSVLLLIFLAFWLYGVAHMPAAISEQIGKSHHPDEDVRALQDGEISIAEYAERKSAKQSSNSDSALTQHRNDEPEQ